VIVGGGGGGGEGGGIGVMERQQAKAQGR